MAIGHDLIEAALRRIGRLASGSSATTAERADGVLELNRMLEGWSIKLGPVYFETNESLTWVGGNASRTIGVSGDLNTSRPLKILKASITVSGVDYPLTLATNQEYQMISSKTLSITLPELLAYNPTFASSLGTLYLWPIPSGSVTLLLTSYKPLTALTGAGTVTLPPGYEDAIVLCLAVRFADGDFASQISPGLRKQADDALRSLIVNNVTQEPMIMDSMAPGMTSWDNDYTRYTIR